jgi:hypothetical protein
MYSFDAIEIVLFQIESTDAVAGFRFAGLCRRLNRTFGQASLHPQLSQRGQYLRFLLQNREKIVPSMLSTRNVPPEFLCQFADSLNWGLVSSCGGPLPEWFLRRYEARIDWGSTIFNKHLDIPTILKFSKDYCGFREYVIWDSYSSRDMPVEFFEANVDKLVWRKICRNPHVPTHFYRKHIDKLVWKEICRNKNADVEFLRENVDKLHWWYISYNAAVPLDFIEEHANKVDWWGISKRIDLTEAFLRRNERYIIWPVVQVPIPEDLVRKYLSHWKGTIHSLEGIGAKIADEHSEWIDWTIASMYDAIPTWFLEKHLDKINWRSLSGNKKVDPKFLDRHADKLWWQGYGISRNEALPMWFFRKHKDRLDWNCFCGLVK